VHSDVISGAHEEPPNEAGDGLKEDVEGDEQRQQRLNRTISMFEAAMLAFVAVPQATRHGQRRSITHVDESGRTMTRARWPGWLWVVVAV
jgi:hypothetical protein